MQSAGGVLSRVLAILTTDRRTRKWIDSSGRLVTAAHRALWVFVKITVIISHSIAFAPRKCGGFRVFVRLRTDRERRISKGGPSMRCAWVLVLSMASSLSFAAWAQDN